MIKIVIIFSPGFLNLSTIDIWDQIDHSNLWGIIMCIVECIAASIPPFYYFPVVASHT